MHNPKLPNIRMVLLPTVASHNTIMSTIWLPPVIRDSSHDIGGTSSGFYILPSILCHDWSIAPHKCLKKQRTPRWLLLPLIVPHPTSVQVQPSLLHLQSTSGASEPRPHKFMNLSRLIPSWRHTYYRSNYPNSSNMEHFHKARDAISPTCRIHIREMPHDLVHLSLAVSIY